jgi:hypothetical protein
MAAAGSGIFISSTASSSMEAVEHLATAAASAREYTRHLCAFNNTVTTSVERGEGAVSLLQLRRLLHQHFQLTVPLPFKM